VPDAANDPVDTLERLKEETLARRHEIVSHLEESRGSKIITLIHRVEPWSEDSDEITIEDSEYVLMNIHRTPRDQPIDLVIHTPGGLVLSAEMIARALKVHQGKVTAFVPFYAMSGGTMIALAADEIVMESFSVLGPLDPQIGGRPAGALLSILEHKPIEAIADDTLVLASIARQAVEQVKAFVHWLMQGRLEPAQLEMLAEFLTGGYLTHDAPLTPESLQGMGVKISSGVPEAVYDLFSTCEFGVCKRPCIAHYDHLIDTNRGDE